ncbi:MAG: Sir2 family NAD-dependent protein deacetylase [Tissierellia bacterium]|nr:Sir2 family NAD-dependent protein deacetylase [Tissierellia bacterium]
MDQIKKAAELIVNGKYNVALTGAGISTESGIPDFRSASGYYASMDPMAALSRDTLLYNPKRFYNEGYRILEDLAGKEPNKGHKALKKLQDLNKLQGIITQNIDNLHTRAGSAPVYEVHGETRGVHCNECNGPLTFEAYKEKVHKGEIPPKCDICGGMLRPNVVMFGDMMPPAFEKAYDAAKRADVMIVVGSSLQVAPVSYLPQFAKSLIIVNKERTPYDRDADVVIHEGCGEILTLISEEVEKLL